MIQIVNERDGIVLRVTPDSPMMLREADSREITAVPQVRLTHRDLGRLLDIYRPLRAITVEVSAMNVLGVEMLGEVYREGIRMLPIKPMDVSVVRQTITREDEERMVVRHKITLTVLA